MSLVDRFWHRVPLVIGIPLAATLLTISALADAALGRWQAGVAKPWPTNNRTRRNA
jgi:hypothetical protein